eukprot:CFRG2328T1
MRHPRTLIPTKDGSHATMITNSIPDDHMTTERVGLPPGVSVKYLTSLNLELGGVLNKFPLAYTSYGTLNAKGNNCILVGHSLTSNSNVGEWWGTLLGSGPSYFLNTDRYYIVCVNYLGSPYGSASPLTPRTSTDDGDECRDKCSAQMPLYGKYFPRVTMRDNVNAQRQLLELLGVTHLEIATGGSMGCMLALEMACSYPEFVSELVLVAGCAEHPDWAIGLGDAQRHCIYSDENWMAGDYMNIGRLQTTSANDVGCHACREKNCRILYKKPDKGLYAARMSAMLTYRTPQSITARFARQEQTPISSSKHEITNDSIYLRPQSMFSIESYLRYQGEKFVKRFDGACYSHLTLTLDTHDVGRNRGSLVTNGTTPMRTQSSKRQPNFRNVLKNLKHRTLVVGIDSDNLYPIELQREMALYMPNSLLYTVKSPHGHDSFLIEIEQLNKVVCEWRDGNFYGERVLEAINNDTRDWARAMEDAANNKSMGIDGQSSAESMAELDNTPRVVGIFL